MIYITLVLALIIFIGIIYYCTRNSRRYRIIEECPEDYCSIYYPQVRIKGVWYGLTQYAYLAPHGGKLCLDPQDAIAIIDLHKESGEGYIPSNQRLKSNQKAIHVE